MGGLYDAATLRAPTDNTDFERQTIFVYVIEDLRFPRSARVSKSAAHLRRLRAFRRMCLACLAMVPVRVGTSMTNTIPSRENSSRLHSGTRSDMRPAVSTATSPLPPLPLAHLFHSALLGQSAGEGGNHVRYKLQTARSSLPTAARSLRDVRCGFSSLPGLENWGTWWTYNWVP